MTSNYTLKRIEVLEFLKDVSVCGYHNHPQAGHIIERHCSWFFRDISIEEYLLIHLYADSHGTQGRGDRYNEIKSQLL